MRNIYRDMQYNQKDTKNNFKNTLNGLKKYISNKQTTQIQIKRKRQKNRNKDAERPQRHFLDFIWNGTLTCIQSHIRQNLNSCTEVTLSSDKPGSVPISSMATLEGRVKKTAVVSSSWPSHAAFPPSDRANSVYCALAVSAGCNTQRRTLQSLHKRPSCCLPQFIS